MSEKETHVENSIAVNKPKAYEGTEPYLFISYARDDSDIVLPIIEHLQSRGVRLWYDDGIDPGSPNFEKTITDHIQNCCVFVSMLTANFYKSDYCPGEMRLAKRKGKTILPLTLDNTPIPDDLYLLFGTYQGIEKYRIEENVFYHKFLETECIKPCIAELAFTSEPNPEKASHGKMPAVITSSILPPLGEVADNQEYLDHFTEPLFLEEDDDSKVTLASMYVSPHLKYKDESVAECIMQWFDSVTRTTCMLLFGNAGIGKSSLVSKIIADAYSITQDEDKEFQLSSDQVLAVALRNLCDKIDMTKKADEILTSLFSGYAKQQLKSKLLILDGLDEVCVLCKDFDGYKFLEKLAQLERGFHVLVTSRDAKGYFSNPSNIQDLRTETLQWTIPETEIWCSKYFKAKEDKRTWCNQFIEDYRNLDIHENDYRKEAFCVPIILYICGESEIKLSDHKNIGSIYGDAFRKILLRSHLRGHGDYTDLTEADKKSNLIAWQYTKEIAYQMFLLETLDLAESNDSANKHAIGLKNAKKRTKTVLQEKYEIDVPDNALELKKELALCPFTRVNGTGGITFAHKTVYEYFTAVKLYEDYFAKFNKSYFCNPDKSAKAAEDVIKAAIAAFRYKATPKDIFQYLCGMNDAPFSGEKKKVSDIGLDYGMFEQAYIKAMDDRILDKLAVTAPVEEYIYSDPMQENPINAQVIRAFRALTCFLTGHGFQNINGNEASKRFRSFLVLSEQNIEQNISIMGWDLRGADLHGTHLRGADLTDADLSRSNLTRANLNGAYLTDADLTGADLTGANLTFTNFDNAKLSEAKLTNAKLIDAKLTGADLKGVDLKGADLNCADLSGADLTDAKLTEAKLTGAYLTDAKLTGAYLIGADLTDAKLTGAYLTGAKYSKHPEYRTQFPDDFDPVAHIMIEADINDIIYEEFLSILDSEFAPHEFD